jgi:hypothetical protein
VPCECCVTFWGSPRAAASTTALKRFLAS